MPTAASSVYSADAGRLVPLFPKDARRISVQLLASTTYLRGTVLGEVTATPGTYGAYLSTNTNGTANATLILEYACTTDASGNITSIGEWGQTRLTTPAFYMGDFRSQELSGLDANAILKLGARLVEGTNTIGILHLG